MSFLVTLIAAVLVFGTVIAIHELGHFTVAKLCGIQVNEFSIGMGPQLWGRIYKGTQYSLRALPIGGFVALEGEQSPESEQAQSEAENVIPLSERTGVPLGEAPIWQRMLVMAAGAFMNFVLGFVVLLVLTATQEGYITSRVVCEFDEGALCAQTGLEADDEIIAVNGRRCFVANDIIYELARTGNYQADFTVMRGGVKTELENVRFDTWQDDDGQTHMSIGFTVYGIKKTPVNVLKEAASYVLYYGRIVFTSLADLVRGRESINDLSGPVGIVSAISKAAGYGWRNVLDLLALITINIGIFNLLPFPALDGGKIVLLLLEGATGRSIPEKVEGALTAAAFALLFGLMLFATYNDIIRLAAGEL